MNDTHTSPAADDADRRSDDASTRAGRPDTNGYGYGYTAPNIDPSALHSAYAFDGSGPYLYGPDGSGPYAYAPDGRGPFLIGSAGFSSNAAWSGAFGTHPGKKRSRRRIGLAVGGGITALAIVGGLSGTVVGLTTRSTGSTTSSQSQSGSSGSSSGGTSTLPGQGGSSLGDGSGTSGSGSTGSDSGGTSSESTATAATSSQKQGVVTIVSTLDYDSSEQAAGTGMIISSDGEILTNNHVIEGATSITVTDESTNKSYKADVVGTDATDDVAVLKLENASGLKTVTLDDDNDLSTGDSVTDVGNAEGTGSLVAATGTVTALNQHITVQSESGSGSESLSGLIEIEADVVSGDSGGPVLDSEGEVVGMATAASSGSSDVTGYAITISKAESIAKQILAGESSSTITIGLPAFLGVEVGSTSSSSTSGVTISGTVSGSPAASAGLVSGDTITSIDGTAVSSSTELTKLIQAHSVGDSVQVGYTNAAGTASTVTVTLTAGPAA